jgi:predicted amidohydrolase
MRRREFIAVAGSAAMLPLQTIDAAQQRNNRTTVLRLALLHLAPRPGDLLQNRGRVMRAIEFAGKLGAHWIVTAELSTTGYSFAETLGTEWIAPQPDEWTAGILTLAEQYGSVVFLSVPERDADTSLLYNSLLVLVPARGVAGRHRKVNALRVGSEAWSTPGREATVVNVPPWGPVGLLVCADACTPAIAAEAKRRGASFLVSSAAWAPGEHGPSGEWERITAETNLPLFVCNRTGPDATISFEQAETVVVDRGVRLLSASGAEPFISLVDWSIPTRQVVASQRLAIPLV